MQVHGQKIMHESAKALANEMQKKLALSQEKYHQDLMEYLQVLYPDGIPEFSDYKGLLIELACILTDAKVSSKFDDKYFAKSAGKILKKMITFFTLLEDHGELQRYMAWYNLEHFSGGIELNELEKIRYYFKNQSANED